MIPASQFRHHVDKIGADPYHKMEVKLDYSLLKPKVNITPALSILISTYHRKSQLQRSLFTLAKQDFQDFEIIICDDGDDYNVPALVEPFRDSLHISVYRRDRYFHVDPSGGFRHILPHAKADYVALMQPELMLHPMATWTLRYGHDRKIPDEHTYAIGGDGREDRTWVVLKTLFFSPTTQWAVDTVDWQHDITHLHELPEFFTEDCGLGGFPNRHWWVQEEMPWWFIASCRKDAPILRHLPEYLGHASIDFYLLGYRTKFHYLDIMSYTPMAYHQDHHRFSVAPEGEADGIKPYIEGLSDEN